MFAIPDFNDSIRENDEGLNDFYNSESGGTIDKFLKIEQKLFDGDYTSARSIWDELPGGLNEVEGYYKEYYNVYMHYKVNGDSINSTDSTTLAFLAQLCPSTQGASAFYATVLYRSIYGEILDCNCEESGARHSFIKNDDGGHNYSPQNRILIFPNPAQSRLNIVYKGSEGPLEVEIFDLTGRILFNKTLLLVNGKGALDLNLNNGTYLVSLLDSANFKFNTTLIISK